MVVVRGKAKRQADRQPGNYRNRQMYKTIRIEGEAEKLICRLCRYIGIH
jgi:hypothetical protein